MGEEELGSPWKPQEEGSMPGLVEPLLEVIGIEASKQESGGLSSQSYVHRVRGRAQGEDVFHS